MLSFTPKSQRITAGLAAVMALAADQNRKFLSIQNLSDSASVNISLDGPFIAGASSVQALSFSEVPTAGSYTLAYAGQVTAPLAFDDDAAAVQDALAALSTIGAGNVAVTGDTATGMQIAFGGTLADMPASPITAVSNLTTDAHKANEVQMLTVLGHDGQSYALDGAFKLSLNGIQTGDILNQVGAGCANTAQYATYLKGVMEAAWGGTITVTALDSGFGDTCRFTVEFGGTLGYAPLNLMQVVENTLNDSTATNSLYTLSFAPAPTGGAFKLGASINGGPAVVSGDLAYNATDSQMQAILEALAGVGAGNVSVSLDSGTGVFTIEFSGALVATPVKMWVLANSIVDNPYGWSAGLFEAGDGLQSHDVLVALEGTLGRGPLGFDLAVSRVSAGVATTAVTITVTETQEGVTPNDGTVLLAGAEPDVYNMNVPNGEVWLKASAAGTPVQVTWGA